MSETDLITRIRPNYLTRLDILIKFTQQLELVFMKHYVPNFLILTLFAPNSFYLAYKVKMLKFSKALPQEKKIIFFLKS